MIKKKLLKVINFFIEIFYKIFLLDIESIEKKRFNEECTICHMIGYGPTIKCEKLECNVRFHVECARINKFQMEFVNNSIGEVNISFNKL